MNGQPEIGSACLLRADLWFFISFRTTDFLDVPPFPTEPNSIHRTHKLTHQRGALGGVICHTSNAAHSVHRMLARADPVPTE